MTKNMKKILITLFLFAVSFHVFAQNSISQDYRITTPLGDCYGTIKYSYVVSDEGERIKNGPITATIKENTKYDNWEKMGSYQLNASAKNGQMNGAMSVQAKFRWVNHYILGDEVSDCSYSFNGGFINGSPNGNFVIKASDVGKCNVNYKNGILVGAYSVDYSNSSRCVSIKGTLNDKGEMIGTWTINESYGVEFDTWEFVKGVRIRESTKNSESTPKQVEMAKKYAAGTISKDELENEGFVPVRDSISLGDYVTDLVYLGSIANWSQLADCSFKASNWVYYTYLYNLLPLPDREFEKVISYYRIKGEAPLAVNYDKLAKCYVTSYWEDYGTSQARMVYDRRFTESQLKAIEEAIDSYCRQHPITLSDLFYNTNHYSIRDKLANLDQRFEDLKKVVKIKRAYSSYNSLIKDLEDVSETLQKIIEGKDKTSDGLYYIIPGEKPLSAHYYSISALEKFYAFEKEVKEYISILDQRAEEEGIAAVKKAEEERISKEEQRNAVTQAFISGLSGIEKKSSNKASELLNRLTVKMGYRYNERIPKNSQDITSAELAAAIAPVIEYSVVEIVEEESGYGTYRITIEFKKKKETVPVSMSITKDGKIIDGSISIPEDMLNAIRKKAKNKQAVIDFLK